MILTYRQIAHGKRSTRIVDIIIGINMSVIIRACDSECDLLPLCRGHVGAVQRRTVSKILLKDKLSTVLHIDIRQMESSLIAGRDRLSHLCYR